MNDAKGAATIHVIERNDSNFINNIAAVATTTNTAKDNTKSTEEKSGNSGTLSLSSGTSILVNTIGSNDKKTHNQDLQKISAAIVPTITQVINIIA